ncbi:MAG: hypothetical protein K5786_10875 [Treponema sp.]|nr:hypothetical protein [Treponema sp.]
MKKLSKIFYVLCFFGLIIGCSNSSASTSGDSKNSNDVTEFVKEGDYTFLFESNDPECDDEIIINFSLPDAYNNITTKFNGKQIAASCTEFGSSSMKETQYIVFTNYHKDFGRLRFYWSRTFNNNYQIICNLHINNREQDFNLVSVTRNEENITPHNIRKLYNLSGNVIAYKNDENNEVTHWTNSLKSGDTIILKYQKKDNQKFEDKYYLSLYNPDSYDSDYKYLDYVRGENNNPTFTYTFKETDIGRKLAVCIRGIEEYEGSIIPLKNGGTIGFSDFTVVEED